MEKISEYLKLRKKQFFKNGGLKLVEIENFDASTKISWVQKMQSYRAPYVAEDSGQNIDIDKMIQLVW